MTIARTVCLSSVLLLAGSAFAHEKSTDAPGAKAPQAKLENLTRTALEGAEGIEVIVSRVTIPPHTALPKHWHPGEEFAYLIEGSITLWQEGRDDTVFHAGDVGVVPLRQVHTAITGDMGATLIVFRVHEQGQPERILVE
jgi:quercetin dioxygenase-like cupin family protein